MNKLCNSSNECPYPNESPSLSLFPKQLDLLDENNYNSIGDISQSQSIICQTPGRIHHGVNSSASNTTDGQNLNLTQRVTAVELDEEPPPSYDQIMQQSVSNVGTSPYSSNEINNYSRRIIFNNDNLNIENIPISVDYVDTVNICFGSAISIFFIFVVLFAMYQLLSSRS